MKRGDKVIDDGSGERGGRLVAGQVEFWLEWWLVGIADAGEVGDFSGSSGLIETFGVAAFADFEGSIDEDFDEVAGLALRADPFANAIAIAAIGADEGGEGNETGGGEELGESADATDIFFAVEGGEA